MNGRTDFTLSLKVNNYIENLYRSLKCKVIKVSQVITILFRSMLFENNVILGEEGQDAGGLLREWYVIISREIFNPMYALFTVSPGDRVTYMINSSSHCNPNHLCYYKFVGRVIGESLLLYFQ